MTIPFVSTQSFKTKFSNNFFFSIFDNDKIVRNRSVHLISTRRLCIFDGIEWYEISQTKTQFDISVIESSIFVEI